MKIVHVVPNLPADIQGDHRHVLNLAGTQRARGLNAAVVTDNSGLFSHLCEQHGIPVFVVDDLLPDALLPKGEVTPSASSFGTKIKEFGADIIHSHNLPTARATVVAANRLRIPYIITLHTPIGLQTVNHFTAARRSGLEFAIIAVSQKQFEIMQQTDMAGIEFHYVPNGTRIPSGTDRQERNKSCIPNLMVVGSLSPVKGVDIAILVMLELRRKRGPGCPILNIYGEGPQGKYYIEMTKVLHLDDVVKFHGVELDILDKCSSSDILVVPSRFETGPLVVLEAMSRGMPIVATDVGEVNEMLPDQQYGRVVPVESITELADAIDSTLTDITSGQFNPDLLVERHQAQYSIEIMADRIEEVYQSVRLGQSHYCPSDLARAAHPRYPV